MTGYTLTIPGDPVAKGRPRVFHGHGVTPRKTVLTENRIYTAFTTKYPDTKPLTGPIRIDCTFYMRRQGKPDWDNLAKLATDALNGVAYVDDAQIVSAHVEKIMPDRRVPGAKPGVMRHRKPGDPLTYLGQEYEAHISLTITAMQPQQGEQQ